MVVKVADYIISPLGFGTQANYQAVKAGKTLLQRYDGKWGLPKPFVASFLDDSELGNLCEKIGLDDNYTRFEKMAIAAVVCALKDVDVDVASGNTMFVLASTKGNVHLLAENLYDERIPLSATATKIARWFGNERNPIVISNACISGLNAQIEAMRILNAGCAETVVVVAADMLSPFIVSGFQAFNSMSDEICRPFDESRLGLNLGEAAACVVYQQKSEKEIKSTDWIARAGAVYNDAFHISHPSRSAEGGWRALKAVMQDCAPESFALVNVHGTATMYNDEMEAVALNRAGLSDVPINSLKSYFGHTLGAAGLLETLISMAALDDGVVLGTNRFSELGVSRKVNISGENRPANGKRFIKIISGFGGCNSAMRFETVE